MSGDEPPAPTDPGSIDDPYADVDLADLPAWWRDAVEEFERHDLPPYRPPRFSDGALKPEVVGRIEEEFDVAIDFVGIDTRHEEDWTVRIDGEPVGTIGHGRTADRSPRYGMTSDEFESFVRSRIEGDADDA